MPSESLLYERSHPLHRMFYQETMRRVRQLCVDTSADLIIQTTSIIELLTNNYESAFVWFLLFFPRMILFHLLNTRAKVHENSISVQLPSNSLSCIQQTNHRTPSLNVEQSKEIEYT